MIFEFVLGAAIVVLTPAALMVWLSSVTHGFPAMVLVASVMTVAVLILMAHAAIGVSLVDALHLLLVVSLIGAPILAISIAQLRRRTS